MDIWKLCLLLFFSQLLFVYARTSNVRQISKGNMQGSMLSGAFLHIVWLITIGAGGASAIKVLFEGDLQYLWAVAFSLSGGLFGTYLALKNKKR